MAEPTTLIEYAEQQFNRAQAAKQAAQTAVAEAQAKLSAARKVHDQATQTLATFLQNATAIRKQLATIPTPADGDVLIDELEQTLIQLRGQQVQLLTAQEGLATAQADVEQANSELRRATAELTQMEVALKEAEQQSQHRISLQEALLTPPLDTIISDATGALSAKPHNDAKARIESDIPSPLMGRARERRDEVEGERVKQLADVLKTIATFLLDERDTNGGLAGKVDKRRAAFQQAEDTFFDYALTAKERYDSAINLLTKVADPDNAPLTQAQIDRIQDTDLQAQRQAALDEEKDRDDLLKEVYSKRADLEKAEFAAIAENEDPDTDADVLAARAALTAAETAFNTAESSWTGAAKARDDAQADLLLKQAAHVAAIQAAQERGDDPATDADVIAAQAALDAAQTALDNTVTAYRASPKGILDAWEAAVPDTTWRHLADFDTAVQRLNGLKDSTPVALVSAMGTAETELVEALVNLDQSRSVRRRLEDESAVRTARIEFDRSVAQRRMFSALRGDD
jgi:hypothetical protein